MTIQRNGRSLLHPYVPQPGAIVGLDGVQTPIAEWERQHPSGWTWQQILAASAPFIAGGVGALASGAGAGASGASAVGGSAALPALPAATAGLGSGAAGAAAAGGAGMAGLGWGDAISLAPMVASLFTHHGNSGQVPMNDEMSALLGMQRQRLQASDPLYQAVLRMAMSLMPTGARGMMPGQAPGQMPGGPSMAVPRTRY